MFYPEEMKINRFKEVAIPEPRDYFQRLGYSTAKPEAYTGEEETAPSAQRTLDMIHDMDAYDKMMQKEEAKKASENAKK